MTRRNRLWVGGAAAALGAGLLVAGPLRVVAQGDEDDQGHEWVAEVLDDLVSDGTLTQQQADAVDEALETARPEKPFGHGHGRGPFGGPGGRFGGLLGLDAAADAIGIDERALFEDLRDGQTLAEVAAANDVEVQTVIDALAAAIEARLDAAVAEGRLSTDDAADRLADVTERITTLVEEGFLGEGRHHRNGDDEQSDETESDESTTTTTG